MTNHPEDDPLSQTPADRESYEAWANEQEMNRLVEEQHGEHECLDCFGRGCPSCIASM